MRIFLRFMTVFLLALSTALLFYFGDRSTAAAVPRPENMATPFPPTSTPASSGWLLLPPFPENATQADRGAEIYRLVCQSCHGDRRQGLTADWIATWPEQDQNCWTSKCHAANHPPDGFELPHTVPALGGAGALRPFSTALDLYQYIHDNMPWHNPGSLTDEQYWQLSAFLLREQGITALALPLDEKSAANLRLHPETTTPVRSLSLSPPQSAGHFWWGTLAVLAIAVLLTLVLLYRCRHMPLGCSS